jgi:hypothetical protein
MTDLYRMVRDSGLFDASWYRSQTTATRLTPSPILHYALRGWKAGLNPSPRFDTQFYWDSYRDVRQLGANPLIHYLLHGHKEGRLATTTGKAVRLAHIPAHTPLPLFSAPGTGRQRLSVVIDDHTPQVTGLGLTPVVALATATAHHRDWMLRFIIRSTTITRADIAAATPAFLDSPHVDVVSRAPGPTADVDCVTGEIWWATSATSLASLRDFVPAETLWWVVSADEAQRHPAGELRLLCESQMADPGVASIVLGKALQASVKPAGATTVIDPLPPVVEIRPSATTPPTLGVIVDDTAPDNLFGSSLKLIEEAFATGILDPQQWTVKLVGSLTRPVTLTGSVVPLLATPRTPSEWASELASCHTVICLGAGTEPAYLADALTTAGIHTVTSGIGARPSDNLLTELASAITQPPGKTHTPPRGLAEAVTLLDTLWSDGA